MDGNVESGYWDGSVSVIVAENVVMIINLSAEVHILRKEHQVELDFQQWEEKNEREQRLLERWDK